MSIVFVTGSDAAFFNSLLVALRSFAERMPGHLLIGNCRMTVRDIDLIGPFKLFLAEELRLHQLQLLASFIAAHGETLLRLGICSRAAPPAEGYEFVTL